MIKSKLKFESYDLNNEKVPNPQMAQQKNLAKAGVKKVANKDGLVTTFHLILNYFKDEAGKALGHLLDVGENKKLSKHFEQVEMKSGKLDKSMSASQKEAATGKIYVKKVNDKPIVHIEPHESCKVPAGKWAKILKELKPQFGGMKGVVVLGGTVLSDESGEEETTDEITKEQGSGTGQRQVQLQKMQKGVEQMDGAVGKTPRAKLYTNIDKYETALERLIQQAKVDGIIDDQEQAEIDALSKAIEALRENVNQNGSKINEKNRTKIGTNIDTMSQTVKNILKDLGV